MEITSNSYLSILADDAIKRMIKILEKYTNKSTTIIEKPINNYSYSNEQLNMFANGSLF